jgi:signal transduction histidine kinase
VLSVEDRGTGIPDTDLERIFEPFQSTKAQGLGLGLSICRTIVSAHGGRLWAANNPQRGATLHLELPSAGPGAS